ACPPVCPNGKCEMGEDCMNCPNDCGVCPPVCPNGMCEQGETCSNCAADCGACPPVCGNNTCETASETCMNCQQDCLSCTCAHSFCVTGGPLNAMCDNCIKNTLCFFEPQCCSMAWDANCIAKMAFWCNKKCS